MTFLFFFQAEDGIRDATVTGVQTCALPILDAGRLQSLLAELARAVRPREWSDHQIALLDRSDRGAEILHEADELVPHPVADRTGRHRVVRPQIAAADARTRDANQSVCWLDEPGVGHGLDTHIVRAVHHSCSHVEAVLPLLSAILVIADRSEE